MQASNVLKLHGRSTITAWRRGMIPEYLRQGLPLKDAQALAFLSGGLVHSDFTHNLIVSAGKALAADLLIDVGGVGLTYHAIGTGTTAPASGNTSLATEAARKLWTSRSRSGNVLAFSIFYLASESTFNIKEAGVFGGAGATGTPGSGTLFSRYLQAYDNSAGLVDLTFDYELTVG